MKIVYMGTPDFAVSPLRALHDAGHAIVLAITQPDAVRDRGKKVKFSPVKEEALSIGIEVIQPERIKNDREAIDRIKSENPDIIAVAAFGQILPKEVLDIPKLGCINAVSYTHLDVYKRQVVSKTTCRGFESYCPCQYGLNYIGV